MNTKRTVTLIWTLLTVLSLATACTPERPAPAKASSLVVTVIYPTTTHSREMGQDLKAIVGIADAGGNPVTDATVRLSVSDASGNLIGNLPAAVGSGDVYRTSAWTIPHKLQYGTWTIRAEAETATERGSGSTTFQVKDSVSEKLLSKYGFWADAPVVGGINPDLFKELGDARNGVILWGGLRPAQHIFPETWLEVQWREGDFHLATADQVQDFLLNTLGDAGFSPIRAIGPFERVKFKAWDAWKVKVRSQYTRYDGQWMIFYAPEAGKTYALGTTFARAPQDIDPHAALRDGFEVHPEVHANGTAPLPLPRLMASPDLIGPELGTRFIGTDAPVLLTWKSLKALASDEFYRVKVDYNYSETNTTVEYWTRETQLELPQALYDTPNCAVFNWQVTLMQKTGERENGQPMGKALSHGSLYWYVEWFHPPGVEAPFKPRCPNPQT